MFCNCCCFTSWLFEAVKKDDKYLHKEVENNRVYPYKWLVMQQSDTTLKSFQKQVESDSF